MSVEQHRRSEPQAPIADPQAFLSEQFQRLRVAQLAAPPSQEVLQWLPTSSDVAGFYSHSGDWYAIKASDRGIPAWMVPVGADVFLYSQPHIEEVDIVGEGIPSPADFLNAQGDTRNLIVSARGITEYKRVDGEEERRELQRVIYGWRFNTQRPGIEQEYDGFLVGIEAEYTIHPWNSINAENLAELLSK